MKKWSLCLLAVVLLLSCTACFRSTDEPSAADATSSTPTESTDAAIVTDATNEASVSDSISTEPSTSATTASTAAGNTDPTYAALTSFPAIGYATDSVNVRKDASTDYDAIGGLAFGEQVTVLAREGDWYQIQWGSTTAYVSAQYVSGSIPTTVATTTTTTAATEPTTSLAAALDAPSSDDEL